MIIQPKEVDDFERFLDEFERKSVWSRAIRLGVRDHGLGAPHDAIAEAIFSHLSPEQIRSPLRFEMDETAALTYLRNNPHLLIPSGFDEVRVETKAADVLAKAFQHELAKREPGYRSLHNYRLPNHSAFEFMTGIHCRQLSSGLWFRTATVNLEDYSLELRPASVGQPCRLFLRDILQSCKASLRGDTFPAVLLLPGLWHPPTTQATLGIVDTARDLVVALSKNDKNLEDLTWQELEDLVAELLRARGMKVSITPRSNDGGRDIVARGELIPGETALMAVEIKHRPVVKVADVRQHLYANGAFPLLLVATSGRFTAGVVKEKSKPENFLRLQLKNGEGLKAWIKEYPL